MARLSQSSPWRICFLVGALAIVGVQAAACSAEFHSCYETRTCRPADQAGSGAAGEGAGDSSGEAGQANTAGSDSGGAGTRGAPVDSSVGGSAGTAGLSNEAGEGGAGGVHSAAGTSSADGSTCRADDECQSTNCSLNPVTGAGRCCQSADANCGSCVDLKRDINNCGSCGNKCALNRTCEDGACTCPGYTFAASCGGCGSWTFETNSDEGWSKNTDPALASGANGVQNTGHTSTAANVHDGTGALAVPINVDYISTSVASVAVPFCQPGVTANLGGFTVSFWVKFAGNAAFDESSDDVFLFVGAWSSSSSIGGPALFKKQMPINTWISVTRTYPVSIAADHISIELHPGGQWQGTMFIDSVLVTGL